MVHLYQSLKNTIKFGYQSRIIEDSLGNSASNFGLIYKSILLGNILKRTLKKDSEEPVGLMLPNIVPTAIVFQRTGHHRSGKLWREGHFRG